MKVLIHLEPIPFRNKTNFIEAHLGAFIEPILRALAEFEIANPLILGISSNVFLCLKSIEMIRRLAKDYQIIPYMLPVYTNKLLSPSFDDSIANYCLDIYSRDEELKTSSDLTKFFDDLFEDFNPDVVLTTSDNRYLMSQCIKKSVPLLSCEFGPLPRSIYPKNRFLNIGGHLNTDLLSSIQKIEKQLKDLTLNKDQINEDFSKFKRKFFDFQKNNPNWKIAEKFFKNYKQQTIAMLCLQPRDWVTWEGALGKSLTPSEIIRRALRKMKSDILVVTFHADKAGDISSQIFSEIWLSDSRLEKLPDSLSHNSSELILPFIDEVLSVSSNTVLTAFLLNKIITPISNSWVSVLANIQNKFPNEIDAWGSRIFTLFNLKYFVEDVFFNNPKNLSNIIKERLNEKKIEITSTIQSQPQTFKYYRSLHLEEIHESIQLILKENESLNDVIRSYGRNALGYLTKKNSLGVELGVAAGYFSESLIRTGRFKQLCSIDLWNDHHDQNEYEKVRGRLHEFGERSRIIRKSFYDALNDFEDQSIDFIYIDGYAHKGKVAIIFQQWQSKLKPGAFVSGHDYCKRFWPENFKSINSLETFADSNGIKFVPGILNNNNEDIIPSFYFKLQIKS